ncbi:MAG: methionyl-tRNA formyltransferase [bacterium]|nr:methionyl-tRNA formyltransferase [bacterium]
MEKLKVVFMGTPLFSVNILEALNNKWDVVLVVTSPDAYIGRKRVLTPCPVKKRALELGLSVSSPEKVCKDFSTIVDAKPDVIVTCAYGQIVSKDILDIPKYGCINIHASLLPKYRGGAPIHYALINGEAETGITLMYMDEGMDTGDMLVSESVKIEDNDNIETLSDKLSLLGADMISRYLEDITDGKIERIKQDNEKASFARIIKRSDEHLDFNLSNKDVFNKFRALSPNPLPNFIMDDVEYKIAECYLSDEEGETSSIISEGKDYFVIGCASGSLKVTKIKPSGKNIMSVRDFKNGYGSLLGKALK